MEEIEEIVNSAMDDIESLMYAFPDLSVPHAILHSFMDHLAKFCTDRNSILKFAQLQSVLCYEEFLLTGALGYLDDILSDLGAPNAALAHDYVMRVRAENGVFGT